MKKTRNSTAAFGTAILLVVTAATAQVVVQPGAAAPAAPAAPAGGMIDNSGNYQSEVQACKQGRSAEDEATCLKEARNARADKQRGALATGADYRANALARCNALSGDDKSACEARMLGYGSVSGSVAGGGVLREVETVEMPPGQDSVTVVPKTSDPVVVVPAPATSPAPATGSIVIPAMPGPATAR